MHHLTSVAMLGGNPGGSTRGSPVVIVTDPPNNTPSKPATAARRGGSGRRRRCRAARRANGSAAFQVGRAEPGPPGQTVGADDGHRGPAARPNPPHPPARLPHKDVVGAVASTHHPRSAALFSTADFCRSATRIPARVMETS